MKLKLTVFVLCLLIGKLNYSQTLQIVNNDTFALVKVECILEANAIMTEASQLRAETYLLYEIIDTLETGQRTLKTALNESKSDFERAGQFLIIQAKKYEAEKERERKKQKRIKIGLVSILFIALIFG